LEKFDGEGKKKKLSWVLKRRVGRRHTFWTYCSSWPGVGEIEGASVSKRSEHGGLRGRKRSRRAVCHESPGKGNSLR
jgi:hypothetical protein